MPIPNFDALEAIYPDYRTYPEAADVRRLIGGEALDRDITNTCALRMSHAMNGVGRRVPTTWEGVTNRRGANGHWYIIRVANLRTWIRHACGAPGIDVRKEAGTPFDRSLIEGLTGIIAFDIGFRDATGHFDLWYGDHFSHEGGAGRGYFASATRVTLWSGGERSSLAPV